jgi:hypothetical protein
VIVFTNSVAWLPTAENDSIFFISSVFCYQWHEICCFVMLCC